MRRDPRLRILIVEDDAEAAEELAELLEAHGMQVSIATDAVSAIRSVADQRPNVVLVDLQLGNASGADLALAWHDRPGAPLVILLSGRALAPPEAMRFGDKAPLLMRKPLYLPELVAEIMRFFPLSPCADGRVAPT